MISNEKMRAEKCGELKLKTDFLATFGQPKLIAAQHSLAVAKGDQAIGRYDGNLLTPSCLPPALAAVFQAKFSARSAFESRSEPRLLIS
jgi:hypothetical protein